MDIFFNKKIFKSLLSLLFKLKSQFKNFFVLKNPEILFTK